MAGNEERSVLQMVERRLDVVEKRINQHSRDIASHGEKIAATQSTLKTEMRLLHDIRKDQIADSNALHDHMLNESKDRIKMLVGVITAAFTGLGTLAMVGWAIWHVLSTRVTF